MGCKICEYEVDGNSCGCCGFRQGLNPADISLKISPIELKSRLSKGEKILLLDVRGQEEHEMAKIQGSFLLPLKELPAKFNTLSRERLLVFYCHHGIKSLNAARFLVQKGFTNVRSLDGGIDKWSSVIDKQIPTY